MDFDPRDYDARDLGRGSGESRESNADAHGQDPRDNARWPDREPLDRTFNPREPFTRDLNLPRGLDRELVRDRDHEYTLRGSTRKPSTTCSGTSSTRAVEQIGASTKAPVQMRSKHASPSA